MCGHETDGAGVTLHDGAILTGGAIPPHVPGAYPRLSCCGGPVELVPGYETDAREDAVCPLHGPNLYTCPEGCPYAERGTVDDLPPVVPEGPGWACWAPGESREAFASAYLNDEHGDGATRAVLYVVTHGHGEDAPAIEAGAELTLDDLASLIARAAVIGAAAAIEDGRDRAGLCFERALEAIRLVTPADEEPRGDNAWDSAYAR